MKLPLRSLSCAGIAFLFLSGCASEPAKEPDKPSCTQIEELMRRAEAGDVDAQYSIAWLYYGRTPCLPDDSAKRVDWYQKAATQGHGRAALWLGDSYLAGTGVKQDTDKAIHLYRQAAGTGNVRAMRKLGNLYSSGYRAPKGLAEAAKWYASAVDRGDRYSMDRLLGIMDDLNPEQKRHLQIQFADSKILNELEERRRSEAQRRKFANEWLGTIGIALPMPTEVEGPKTDVKGTRFKGLKVLGAVPLGALVGAGEAGPAGAVAEAVAAPAEILSQPSERQVRAQQKRFAAAYERYADRDLTRHLNAQLFSEFSEQLTNPVAQTPLLLASEAFSYKQEGNVDTVLEIGTIVAGLQFTGIHEYDKEPAEKAPASRQPPVSTTVAVPEARFIMILEYRIIGSDDVATIGRAERRKVYRGPVKDLNTWTTGEGTAIKEAMQTVCSELANQLANLLLELAESAETSN